MTPVRVSERNWAGNLSYGAEHVAHPETVEELQERLSGALVGSDAPVSIIRGGSPMTVSVKVGERP